MLLLGQLYTDDNTNDDDVDNDDTNNGWQWHTMDKSWLHRLIGMYAKWAKNYNGKYRYPDNSLVKRNEWSSNWKIP